MRDAPVLRCFRNSAEAHIVQVIARGVRVSDISLLVTEITGNHEQAKSLSELTLRE